MSRVWAMPNADTFSVPVIGALVKKHLQGVSVDPFARNKRWATYTNDLNPTTDAEYHMDAEVFLNMLVMRNSLVADVLILDPPYSPRQISECYKEAGIRAGIRTRGRTAEERASCRQGARCVQPLWPQ